MEDRHFIFEGLREKHIQLIIETSAKVEDFCRSFVIN